MNKRSTTSILIPAGLILAAGLVILLTSTRGSDAGDPPPGDQVEELLTRRDPAGYVAAPPPRVDRARIREASRVAGVNELGLEGEVLVIEGAGFYGTAVGPFVRIGGVEADMVLLLSSHTIVTTIPSVVRAATGLVVINPDGQTVEASIDPE